MTLYLKYRPQKISELDLVAVRQRMGEILRAKNLPHAFLFTGPRGTGKTSSARILAKAINCKSPVDFEPCGDCEMCIAITNGSSSDVIEIDAASNRGIDEIRSLREQVHLAPMQSKYKVYIIDEVHMLTVEAMNALLKTLEEPPLHALFVLCTTDVDKLLDTVVSRCIHISFGQPTVVEIVDKLRMVATSEMLDITQEDLAMIATASKGSFRDSIKLLEQVIMAGGDTMSVLGMVVQASPGEFLDLVRTNKTVEALDMISLLVGKGVQPKQFIEQAVNYLRKELLANFSDIHLRQKNLALILGLEKAYERSRTTAVAQLPLELFVIEMVGGVSPSPVVAPRVAPQIPVVTVSTTTKPVVVAPLPAEEPVLGPNAAKDLEELIAKWPNVLKIVKAENSSIEALLRSTKPIGFDGTRLDLEVFYAFHKDKLESEKCRLLIEKAVGDAFGSGPAKLKLHLGDKKTPVSKTDNIAGKVGEDIVAAAEAIFGIQAV